MTATLRLITPERSLDDWLDRGRALCTRLVTPHAEIHRVAIRRSEGGIKGGVAVKVYRGPIAGADRFAAALEASERQLADLNHPLFVKPLATGVDRDGKPGVVTPWIKGISVRQLVEREGPIAARRVSRWLEELADGLDFAHARGVWHGDLRLSHVMVTCDAHGEERVRLLNLGMPRFNDRGRPWGKPTDDSDSHIDVTNLSPEQSRGIQVGPAADIYGLGAFLHTCLTGKSPTTAPTGRSLLEDLWQTLGRRSQHAEQDVAIPEPLAEVIREALARNASDRPSSPGELCRRFVQSLESGLPERSAIPDTVAFARFQPVEPPATANLPSSIATPVTHWLEYLPAIGASAVAAAMVATWWIAR